MLNKNDTDMIYHNPVMATLVTSGEVVALFGVTRKQVQWAIWRDHVRARKSVTGGTWLLHYGDCVKYFGKPEHSIGDWLIVDEGTNENE